MPSTSRLDRRLLWRSLSRAALGRVLVGVFFIFATLGFVIDIFDPRSSSFGWVVLTCIYSGAVACLYLLTVIRGPSLIVVAIFGQLLGTFAIARFMPHGEALVGNTDLAAALKTRLSLDAFGVIVCITLGWAWVAAFVNRQALELLLATVELSVAQRLQADLVPPVSLSTPRAEVVGRSIPSSQMGGDVVDALEVGNELVGYVADVSGHGIDAGVLMAVVKGALRTNLLTPRPLSAVLRDLNAVLPALKDSARYVTIAAVRLNAGGVLEYVLAGHLPILHVMRRTRTVAELSLAQMAVGMFPDVPYQSAIVAVQPGDLIALLTDGLTETSNRADEEFGLAQVGELLAGNADRPLSDIVEAVVAAVRRHGRQVDDQSLLVLRVR